MILKDKTPQNLTSVTAKAGYKQEQDVAFFLRRAFKDHPQVFVINDYKFSFNGETAQIDHLVIYPYGFVLIESKSIKGEVNVNALGEWSRSVGKNWVGMPSPIKQVELQQKLLREMLHANRESILGKILGIRQQSFGMRCWDNICAVSSSAIIERNSMPSSVSKQLVKTEFLADQLLKVMKLKNVVTKLNPFDTRPDFSNEELTSITTFLMNFSNVNNVKEVVAAQKIQDTPITPTSPDVSVVEHNPLLKCKSCGDSTNYTAQYGKFGYFIKCNVCETNTAMKMLCPCCQSKDTKVTKKKARYTLLCNSCNEPSVLI